MRANILAVNFLILAALAMSVVFSGCAAKPLINPWAEFTTPAAPGSGGKAEAIGSYSAGCLRGAVSPPPDGPGFEMMRPARGRFYGHPMLVDFIERLGAHVKRDRLGQLLIGDMGQIRGGPAPTGHRSHQIGLDVDIWFWQPSKGRRLSLLERQTLSAPSMVAADGQSLTPEWTPAKEKILKLAANDPAVARIFVNPEIKRALCAHDKGQAWLHKLRPWWGHEEHFHVRLNCPLGDKTCVAQAPIPPGDGCDATLAWWFTNEARAKGTAAEAPRKRLPVLPAACRDLLKL